MNTVMEEQQKMVQQDNDMLEACLSWSEENTWFRPDFFNSLYDSFEKYGALSAGQRGALERIMNKLEIRV